MLIAGNNDTRVKNINNNNNIDNHNMQKTKCNKRVHTHNNNTYD